MIGSALRLAFDAALAACLALSLAVAGRGQAAAAQSRPEALVSLGSGETNGLYYPLAEAICRTAGRDLREQGIRCSAESTPGSVYNIEALESGELDLAIVQSDVQFAAYNGVGPWTGKPVKELRSVLALYPELVTVIARAGAGIRSLSDLGGKRVNVGSQGTGTRATWDAIAAELGPAEAGKIKLTELRTDETTSALCRGEIDANLMIVGHPSPLVAHQLAACPSNLVPITGSVATGLLGSHKFYVKGSIPAKLYGANPEVATFGSRATLVASASANPYMIAAVTKAILTHIADLRSAYPVLAGLKADDMIRGLTAPLHPGAAAACNQLGLLKRSD
jgi:hypothetical protein